MKFAWKIYGNVISFETQNSNKNQINANANSV